MNTFQSRFGYHPCDHETYLKLKRLHKYHWQSVYDFAKWKRWDRKWPENRVIRRRPAKGQPYVVVGPWKEPEYFFPLLRDDIVECYQRARMPAGKPENVKPLTIPQQEIDSLISLLDLWLSHPVA